MVLLPLISFLFSQKIDVDASVQRAWKAERGERSTTQVKAKKPQCQESMELKRPASAQQSERFQSTNGAFVHAHAPAFRKETISAGDLQPLQARSGASSESTGTLGSRVASPDEDDNGSEVCDPCSDVVRRVI